MTTRTSLTYKLTEPQRRQLITVLRQGNYRPVFMEHTDIAAETADCRIALYKSGKCLIQGKGTEDFVTFVMEPLVLGGAQLGYEKVLDPEAFQPHMGVDESGKGDFFGPLVISAAYVDNSLVDKMRELNVRDSKKITSDDKIFAIAKELRALLGNRFSIVRIGAQAYNRLYLKMRSVNKILAWGHARAIENLLEVVPDCPRAISDQFGSKQQVERALMQKARKIKLVQQHRAESDMAVAAASILAREGFLLSLRAMREHFKLSIPKGASSQVKEAAAVLVKKNGSGILLETAKCHFKTTDEVLGSLGFSRRDLGPEGQAVSKTPSGSFKHRHSSSKTAPPAMT